MNKVPWHSDLHKRKPSGGKSHPYRHKRRFEAGQPPAETQLGEDLSVVKRTRGGGTKVKLFSASVAQVSDPKSRITRPAKILRVLKNEASIEYDRRDIITKGALLETELGTVRVTSRPGQHGQVNAVLVQSKSA